MKTFKYDLAACVLIEALFSTDEKACAKYGITPRTLLNYRQRLAEDSKLSLIFHTKKAALDEKWADELPRAMREATHTIAEIAIGIREDAQMRKNPFVLEKLAGALKLCADVYYTGKVIDARIAPTDRQSADIPGTESADAESQAVN